MVPNAESSICVLSIVNSSVLKFKCLTKTLLTDGSITGNLPSPSTRLNVNWCPDHAHNHLHIVN